MNLIKIKKNNLCEKSNFFDFLYNDFYQPWLVQFLSGLQSQEFLGGVGFLRTLGVRARFSDILSDFDSGNPNELFFASHSLVTNPYCSAPRFPLITSCYKISDSQTFFTLCEGVKSRKF